MLDHIGSALWAPLCSASKNVRGWRDDPSVLCTLRFQQRQSLGNHMDSPRSLPLSHKFLISTCCLHGPAQMYPTLGSLACLPLPSQLGAAPHTSILPMLWGPPVGLSCLFYSIHHAVTTLLFGPSQGQNIGQGM